MSKDKDEKLIPPVDEENKDNLDEDKIVGEKEGTTVIIDGKAIDEDELMAKYDRESAFRRLVGVPGKLVYLIAVAWSVFQLYTGLFGTFPSTL